MIELTLGPGTCHDDFVQPELSSDDTGVASEPWVSRRDTNVDRIIEALDKHTGEDCHDVIAHPGGVSAFHPTREESKDNYRGTKGRTGGFPQRKQDQTTK